MPIKKSKTASSLTLQNTPAFGSPFCSPLVYIKADSATLHVHQALVESASPKLLARFQGVHDAWSCKDAFTANLNPISLDVGHILVKWLYSGTYSLRDRQETEGNTLVSPLGFRSCAETLKIAFGVYSLAREYDLSGLEVLAKEQVALLGSATDVFTFIDVIEEAYPRTVGTHDAWLGEYITTRMKAALKEDQENHLVKTTTQVVGQEEAATIPIYKLLVQGMLEACRDVARQIPKVDVQATVHCTDHNPAPAEVLPEVFALAVDSETSNTAEVPATPAEKGTESSDKDDWVFPSPKAKEVTVAKEPTPEPEPSVPEPAIEDDRWEAWGSPATRKDKKKKGKKVLVEDEPAWEPEAQSEPAAEPAAEPVPEAEPEAEPAPPLEPEPVVLPKPIDGDDGWGTFCVSAKKGKKDKKKKGRVVDPEPEHLEGGIQKPESTPVPVEQNVPADMIEAKDELGDGWGWGARRAHRQTWGF